MPDFDPFFDEPSPAQIKADVEAWSDTFEKATGSPPVAILPPGHTDPIPMEDFCPECHIDRGHEKGCPQIKTLEDRAQGQSIVILAKQPRKPWQIYCPACDFMFERTKVAIARTWATDHNNKTHQGQLPVIDLTQHQDSNPTKVTSPLSW